MRVWPAAASRAWRPRKGCAGVGLYGSTRTGEQEPHKRALGGSVRVGAGVSAHGSSVPTTGLCRSAVVLACISATVPCPSTASRGWRTLTGDCQPGTLRGPERDAETEREQDQRAGGTRRAPQILSGQHGGSWFEVVASIVTEVKDPGIAPIDFQVDGRTGTIKVGDVMENSFAPIKNPMTGEDETVQVAIPGGLEYSRGNGVAEILQSRVLGSTDEIAVDLAGRRHPSPAARRRCPPRCAGAPR
jgi:Protein of unknown function (DUF1326)